MRRNSNYHPDLYINILVELAEISFEASREAMIKRKAKSTPRTYTGGRTLRPGQNTPLWNEMQKRLRFHTTKFGAKAILARELGLPRQRIHQFLKEGSAMPDAERTLSLLAWLVAKENKALPTES